MPRITQLPPQSGFMHGNESLVIVNNDVTEQQKAYKLKYEQLTANTNGYVLTALSDIQITTIAEVSFWQNGIQIPTSSILNLFWIDEAPTVTSGTLENLIDGDPNTYITFDVGAVGYATIGINFNNGNINVDEVRITAANVASGTPLEQAPSYMTFNASTALGGNSAYYFDNFWGAGNIALGETKITTAPTLVTPSTPISVELAALSGPTGYNTVLSAANLSRLILRSPHMRVVGNNQLTRDVSGGEGDPINLAYAEIGFELQPYKSHIVTIFGTTAIDGSFLFTSDNYISNFFIVNSNSGPATLTLSPTDDPTAIWNQIGVKRTVFNVHATDSVTLDVTAFGSNVTLVDGVTLVIPPNGSLSYLEYVQGSILVWR